MSELGGASEARGVSERGGRARGAGGAAAIPLFCSSSSKLLQFFLRAIALFTGRVACMGLIMKKNNQNNPKKNDT